MFERMTDEEIIQMLNEDALLLVTVKNCFKMLRAFRTLSPDGKEAVINKCVTMGEEKLANAFRQIADEPMVEQIKKPCRCANIKQGSH